MDSSAIRSSSILPQPSSPNISGNAASKSLKETAAEAIAAAAASQKDDGEDQLDLSSGKLSAMNLVTKLFGVEVGEDGSISIGEIRAAYAEKFQQFTSKLNRLLEQHGIDRSCEAILRSDGTGAIHVANDHPDREKIEAIFQDNPELANEFRGLSATASFLRAADEHQKFSAAYERDPRAAVEQFSHLFDNTDPREFAMRISRDTVTGFFEEV